MILSNSSFMSSRVPSSGEPTNHFKPVSWRLDRAKGDSAGEHCPRLHPGPGLSSHPRCLLATPPPGRASAALVLLLLSAPPAYAQGGCPARTSVPPLPGPAAAPRLVCPVRATPCPRPARPDRPWLPAASPLRVPPRHSVPLPQLLRGLAVALCPR